jgi:hypothetical protein
MMAAWDCEEPRERIISLGLPRQQGWLAESGSKAARSPRAHARFNSTGQWSEPWTCGRMCADFRLLWKRSLTPK